MPLPGIQRLMRTDRNLLLLCGAAFCMALAQNSWSVGLPFLVKGLGGSDMQVSWCAALFMGVYCTLCVVGVRFVERLKARRLLLASSAILAVFFTGMTTLVFSVTRGSEAPATVLALIVLSALHGLFLAAYWPPLMGWVSLGRQGAGLSRRLARFNISWSSGAVLGPFIGGYLIESSWRAWVSIVYAFFIGAFLLILRTRPVPPAPAPTPAADPVADAAPTLHRPAASPATRSAFLWASRLGLMLSFVFIGIFRTHLPIVFKYELSYTESQFGTAVTLLALTNFAGFLILMRWNSWQHRAGLFLGAQGLLALFFVGCLIARPVGAYYLVGALAGLACSFIYISHQFYASEATSNRSAAMAAHEALLGFGFMAGSMGAGWLSDHVGRWTPYRAGFILLGVITLAQAIGWVAWGRKK